METPIPYNVAFFAHRTIIEFIEVVRQIEEKFSRALTADVRTEKTQELLIERLHGDEPEQVFLPLVQSICGIMGIYAMSTMAEIADNSSPEFQTEFATLIADGKKARDALMQMFEDRFNFYKNKETMH